MRRKKQERLEARGWAVGSAGAFLGLSHDEDAYLQLRQRVAETLRRRRQDEV